MDSLVPVCIMDSLVPVCVGTGSVSLDIIHTNNNNKILYRGGGPCGNVLTVLSYFGWDTYPVTRLGLDYEGELVMEDMEEWGVDTRFVLGEHNPSPRILQYITKTDPPSHSFHVRCEHGFWVPRPHPFTVKHFAEITPKLPATNVFFFDESTTSALQMAKHFKKLGATIYFEPLIFKPHNGVSDECVRVADIVKHCEGQSIGNEHDAFDIPLEIVTNGAKGLRYRAGFHSDSWKSLGVYPASRLSGAAGSGDWLSAGVISMLSGVPVHKVSAKKLHNAIRHGQALSTLNCGFLGARGIMYNVSRNKLQDMVRSLQSGKQITLPEDNLANQSKFASKCKTCFCKVMH